MVNQTSTPPDNSRSSLPRRRPPTHVVYQLIENDGLTYRMKVGNAWRHCDEGSVYRVLTVHGEFEINKLPASRSVH